MILVLTLACAELEEKQEIEKEETVDYVQLAVEHLEGRFDSSEQSEEDWSYYAISLVMCQVEAPEIGEAVLYVEQAQVETLNQPYRQRLYVLEGLQEGEVQSSVYELEDPAAAVGLCDNEERYFSADEALLKDGCAVYMRWNGSGFSGETEEGTCRSEINGASYATSIVEMSMEEISSWDQGWNSEGEQVWGAVDGAYVFKRLE